MKDFLSNLCKDHFICRQEEGTAKGEENKLQASKKGKAFLRSRMPHSQSSYLVVNKTTLSDLKSDYCLPG